ncbi:hypothetical protein [Rhizobium halophytocola]|uniref:DUF3108 domain-containing protein n=1 Tax=Rhizobium halophytocola TaxID=735519 RepID=A0ABS4DSY1_9HYPH|nr:hypothetical protein [Rhizobium halophytocola]MBP1848798.1 hypothetical protein [Rhizobium halophytocola]
MRLPVLILTIAACLPPAGAKAQTAYQLLFRPGTLSSMEGATQAGVTLRPGDMIVYDSRHSQTPTEAALTEKVTLTLLTPTEADLRLERGARHRSLGRFPARVGNPMVMYFLEGVLKDISDETGGSPFYLRNRLKEALGKTVDAAAGSARFEGREIATRKVTMTPLIDAGERRKLGRFAGLEVTVITSNEVPGGYLSFVARAPKGERQGGAAYEASITLQPSPDAGAVVR